MTTLVQRFAAVLLAAAMKRAVHILVQVTMTRESGPREDIAR